MPFTESGAPRRIPSRAERSADQRPPAQRGPSAFWPRSSSGQGRPVLSRSASVQIRSGARRRRLAAKDPRPSTSAHRFESGRRCSPVCSNGRKPGFHPGSARSTRVTGSAHTGMTLWQRTCSACRLQRVRCPPSPRPTESRAPGAGRPPNPALQGSTPWRGAGLRPLGGAGPVKPWPSGMPGSIPGRSTWRVARAAMGLVANQWPGSPPAQVRTLHSPQDRSWKVRHVACRALSKSVAGDTVEGSTPLPSAPARPGWVSPGCHRLPARSRRRASGDGRLSPGRLGVRVPLRAQALGPVRRVPADPQAAT